MASFEKINYLLRPSKQVERKLIVEALQKLSKGGYFIHDYSYLGLGSIYYADFILFHKYLLIDSMICAEKANVPKRMEFNKPYAFIDLRKGAVSDVIPTLNRTRKHLVWLDYDYILDQEKLDDIRGCLYTLAPGSILIITVTADPIHLSGLLDPVEAKGMTDEEKQKQACSRLSDLIGIHLGRSLNLGDISKRELPHTIAVAVRNYINTCLASRSEMEFFQLFNFAYADNMQMLSLGGIIDTRGAIENINASGIYDIGFTTSGENPVRISVPPLTIREKIWLEKHMVKNPDPPAELAFEIDMESVETFVKYYRHYPVYYETLV